MAAGWNRDNFELEEMVPLEDFHFKDRIREVYPQLQAYERDLRAKIERLNRDLAHVQDQIKAIEGVLKKND